MCTGRTGHAEAVEVTFDPDRISYEELLDAFWAEHNPKTRNRQGFDVGSQYRSAVFFHSEEQEAAAHRSRERVQESLRWPWQKVVTQIRPAVRFWPAEEYHQRYLEKMGRATCTVELRGGERSTVTTR